MQGLWTCSTYTAGSAVCVRACQHPVWLVGHARGLAKRVIACLDVRANDAGDLVVTKGDQYDVRETVGGNEVLAPVHGATQHRLSGPRRRLMHG